LPLVATAAGMTGLPTRHPLHRLPDARALAASLLALAASQAARQELAAASVTCARAYAAQVRAAAQDLWNTIQAGHQP